MGELAHVSVPDLKEAEGGLRDATVLKALVATWLVDVPHVELERSRQALLDVRDLRPRPRRARHRPDRARDVGRARPPAWTCPTPAAAQVHVRELGRRITHLSRLTWRRVDDVLARPASVRAPAGPSLTRSPRASRWPRARWCSTAAPGPTEDPVLLLRAAAAAAEHDVVLAPRDRRAAGPRDARRCPSRGPPRRASCWCGCWPRAAGCWRSGRRSRRPGRWAGCCPSGSGSGSLPHASAIHRFTVDRHVVETCIEASALIRHVGRPDVLMVAALLHDIGKGSLTEHSVAGEPIARAIADPDGLRRRTAVDLVATPGALAPAARRDRHHPRPRRPGHASSWSRSRIGSRRGALAAHRADRGRRPGHLAQGLVVLARRARPATSPRRAAHARSTPGVAPAAVVDRRGRDPRRAPRDGRASRSRSSRSPTGARVTVVAPDRVGLLADVAGRVRPAADRRCGRPGPGPRTALRRLGVGGRPSQDLDAAVLRQRYDAVVEGRVDPGARLRPDRRAAAPRAPRSSCAPRPREQATVLEVRAADRPGVVLPGLRRAGRARRRRPLRARRHPRAAGRRRVLPPGGARPGRSAETPGRRGRARRPRRALSGEDVTAVHPADPGWRPIDTAHRPGWRAPDRRTPRSTEGPHCVRHTLRPPRRHLQEPARQGPALRGRHRRHRARDPDRAARGRRRAAGGQGVRRPPSRSGPAARRSAAR